MRCRSRSFVLWDALLPWCCRHTDWGWSILSVLLECGLAFSQGAHHLETLDRGISGFQWFESANGLDELFELAVISLDHIVQIFDLSVIWNRSYHRLISFRTQLSLPIHFFSTEPSQPLWGLCFGFKRHSTAHGSGIFYSIWDSWIGYCISLWSSYCAIYTYFGMWRMLGL